MPFGIHHKNRSKQALNDPAAQGTSPNHSGSASPQVFQGEEEARTTQPPVFQQQQQSRQDQPQQYAGPGGIIVPDSDRRAYQHSELPPPARSQSTRYSVGSAYQQQQQQQLLQAQASGSADNLILDSRNDNRKENAPLPPPPAESHKKSSNFFKNLRSGGRNSEHKAAPPQAQYNNTSGLARRLSRRTDNPPVIRSPQAPTASEQQRLDWQAGQESHTHLPSPQEDHEDDVDPYLIRPGQEDAHSAPPSAIQEHNPQQTIRPVQNDSDQSDYDDGRQPPVPPPHGHPQIHHQQSDSTASNHYPFQHHQGHSQQQVNLQLDPYRQQNPETVSQLSYDSPITDQREEQQRPPSHPNGHSPTTYPGPRQEYPNRTSSGIQGPRPQSQYNPEMPPQAGGSQQPSRRTTDRESKQQQTMQGSSGQSESRDGPPPNYSRQGFTGNQNQPPPTPGLQTQTSTASNYRGGPPQREQFQAAGGGEQGRSTPPPSAAANERSMEENYKELLVKYKKVKGLYFDKTAQVEQLQNTLANQRLSQSRTSLDDSEYMTRFQRLDGAIVNLAFNIRKDWQSLPPWIATSCNQDAVKIGKQEMTGVGRACITKFLMDEIFNKTFHPSLDPGLSQNLKAIERNIRRFAPAINNQEESDALTSKIVNWRLATLEGLKEQLSSPQAAQNKADFLQMTTSNLHSLLLQYLSLDPPGIQEVAHSIVDLAVSIASNMPLESRDIHLVYPMPGDILQPAIMKTEGGIPALENPCESGEDESSTTSGEKDEKENDKSGEGGKLRKEKPKQGGGILGGLIGGSNNSNSSGGKKPGAGENGGGEAKNKLSDDGSQRVRFAGFVGIEVRGRQMLGKAPVWTVG